MYCMNHQFVPRHTYKNTVCWKPSMLVCACVPASMHYKHLGPRNWYTHLPIICLAKIAKQRQDEKVSPFSVFCTIVLRSLPSSVSVSLWPFCSVFSRTHKSYARWHAVAQVRAGWIYHHSTGMGRGIWWWWWARPGAFRKTGEHKGLETGTWIHLWTIGGIRVRYRWLDQQRHTVCVPRWILRQMAFRRVKRMSCWSSSHVWLRVWVQIQRNNQLSFFPGDFHKGLPFVVFN